MMSARERATASGFVVTRPSGRARGITGTTPPTGSPATGRGLMEKIGAGWGPGWRCSALIRMAPAAITSTKIPIASSGLRPNARRSNARTPPSFSNSAESTAIARSRTLPHPDVCRQHHRFGNRQTLHIRRRFDDAPSLTIDRQAHGHARSRANAAADADFSTVKFDQSLHNRQAETGAIMRTVIGGADLEERIADVTQIVLADADTGIFNGNGDVC